MILTKDSSCILSKKNNLTMNVVFVVRLFLVLLQNSLDLFAVTATSAWGYRQDYQNVLARNLLELAISSTAA